MVQQKRQSLETQKSVIVLNELEIYMEDFSTRMHLKVELFLSMLTVGWKQTAVCFLFTPP